MVSTKEKELLKLVNREWGKKCKKCGFNGNFEHTFEREKKYLVAIVECPKCGFILLMGEDGRNRWILKE